MITVSLAIASDALRAEVYSCLQTEGVQIDFDQMQTVDFEPLTVSMERSRPDVIVLDVSALKEPIRHVIERLRTAAPNSMLVALDSQASTESVLECFRAGASEYLTPPIAGELQSALGRRETQRHKFESNKPKGRLVVFLSAKGGCGATTLACHIAAGIAGATKKVLLADLDMHAGMVAFAMKSQSPYSMSDAANNTHRLDSSYWSALVSTAGAGLEVISAPAAIAAKQDLPLEGIRKVLEFAHRLYPWTIIDAGRGMTQTTLTALEMATDACIVTTPEVPALHQTRQLLQRLLSSGYEQERVKLILNRVPGRSAIRPEEVQSMLGIRLYASFPDSYAALHEAYCHGELLSPESELGQQFRRLARKLDGTEQPKAQKPVSPLQAALARMKSRAA